MSFQQSVEAALSLFAGLNTLQPQVDLIAARMTEILQAGGKVLFCGNGGSACEAQHFAAELVGRYKMTRKGLPAIALNADGALMSCIGNDFSFESVFARQVEAFGRPGDMFVGMTTSGNSPNVLKALEVAQSQGLTTVTFLGAGGGRAHGMADYELLIDHKETARVQEAHQFLLHCIMDAFEARLASQPTAAKA
jgi:D-sedoheptulose 7-phosphate isomerase